MRETKLEVKTGLDTIFISIKSGFVEISPS